MRLHENKELFRDAVAFTAQDRGLPEIYIEKDYWVAFALWHIFERPSADIRFSKVVQRFPSVSPISTGSARISTWSLSGTLVCLPTV